MNVEELRANGINPYPAAGGVKYNLPIDYIRAIGESIEKDFPDDVFETSGRVKYRNRVGKLVFLRVEDYSGMIQVMVLRPENEDNFKIANGLDIGDWVWVAGTLMRTQAGELTLRATKVTLAAKCVAPFPDRWNGITDEETRVRQRYLDLMMNPESREVFRARARVVSTIRKALEDDGYLEVETSMLHPIPGGANAKPFVTHHNALDSDFYLRVAPELNLKRLIVGGLDRVFEIGKNFRNEGISPRHNPEFTSCEFYSAWQTYQDLMVLLSDMIREAAVACGRTGFEQPIGSVSMENLIQTATGIDMDQIRNPAALQGWWMWHHPELTQHEFTTFGKWWEVIFEQFEGALWDPIFVTGYPAEISPLARRSDTDPEIAERFELYIQGKEIANGFNELNDPEEQARCFEEQVRQKNAGNEEGMYYDADYIEALRYGMPPTAGCGIGIDRLVMILTNQESIKNVILFPAVKPV